MNEVCLRHRPRNVIALALVAAECLQQPIRFRRLDSLGTDPKAQATGDLEDLPDEEIVGAGQRPDEGLVDLQHVGGDRSADS